MWKRMVRFVAAVLACPGCSDDTMTMREVCGEAAQTYCESYRECSDDPATPAQCRAGFVTACCDEASCGLRVEVDAAALEQCKWQLELVACSPDEQLSACEQVVVGVRE